MRTTRNKKTAGLSMALTPDARKLFDRAAKKSDLQTSVWAQRVLLREARVLLGVK